MDFHGERRCNDTRQSTTDPEARLARKGAGITTLIIGQVSEAKFDNELEMAKRAGLKVEVQPPIRRTHTAPF